MERITCKNCQAEYEMTLIRMKTDEERDEPCVACGHVLWSWDSTTMPILTPIEEYTS
jgi:uncharacterized Zn finger protein